MRRAALYIFLIVLLIVSWEYFGTNNQTVRLLLSSPSLAFKYFSAQQAEILLATKTTLIEAVAGLMIATAFSFIMMIICFYLPRFMNFILPIMVTSQVIPVIVLAPFFIIWLGIGVESKIAMAAVISFFPVFVTFAQGYKTISKNIHELMEVYNASIDFRIRNIYFPLSLPSVMAGLKVSATLSVIGAIVAEFTGANIGLGKNLFISAIRLEPDLMMVSLIMSSAMGLFLYGIVAFLEKKLIVE